MQEHVLFKAVCYAFTSQFGRTVYVHLQAKLFVRLLIFLKHRQQQRSIKSVETSNVATYCKPLPVSSFGWGDFYLYHCYSNVLLSFTLCL